MNKILISLFLCLPLMAGDKIYGSAVVDTIISVYDGDTFRCNIIGYPDIIGKNISIRIRGIDTPEIRGSSDCEKRDAYRIRDYVEDRLRSAKIIVLKDVGRPKYFRLLADILVDGVDLARELVDLGFRTAGLKFRHTKKNRDILP